MAALVTLDEAYDAINDPSGADDSELSALIDAVTGVVEAIVGPVTSREVTDVLDGGGDTVVLRKYPVISVDSVTEYTPSAQTLAAEPYGSTYTGYGYRVNLNTGVLTRTSSGTPRSFASGTGNVVVNYTAGRSEIPANVKQAALELIRLHWQPQQSGNLPGISSDEYVDSGDVPFFVPNRVRELLAPSRIAPVVA